MKQINGGYLLKASAQKKPTFEELEHQNTALDWQLQVHMEALTEVCQEHGVDMNELLKKVANKDYSDIAEWLNTCEASLNEVPHIIYKEWITTLKVDH